MTVEWLQRYISVIYVISEILHPSFFQDWVPILAFLEKAVTRFWSEHIAHGSHETGFCLHRFDLLFS